MKDVGVVLLVFASTTVLLFTMDLILGIDTQLSFYTIINPFSVNEVPELLVQYFLIFMYLLRVILQIVKKKKSQHE